MVLLAKLGYCASHQVQFSVLCILLISAVVQTWPDFLRCSTACLWVMPQRLMPSTSRRRSPEVKSKNIHLL